MLLLGEHLSLDSLQFGFKSQCSTSTATWLFHDTLQHYLQRGSRPIAVVLDCSKAFDLARFDVLFQRLLERLPPIIVRALIFCYQEQKAWIQWGRGCTSSLFSIRNGTRQGSVCSPSFWSVYLDPLFSRLREAGYGCRVGGLFLGVIQYADDLVLLSPCRNAAQKMLSICEAFAEENNIRFSTDDNPMKSKSKAMYVTGSSSRSKEVPANLVLCGKQLPWVDRVTHLGHTLTCDGKMNQDT